MKQHRSSEQVISLPDSYASLIFFPLKLSFLLLLHYFLKLCMGDQTEQRRWDSHFMVAGKSSETRAPDAPQRGRKLKPKFLFSVNVVLNKTHGLRGSAGMFRVFEVNTTDKSSSSLIQNTCQVLISVCFGARATQSTCKASCLTGILGSAAAGAPQTAQHARPQVHRNPGNRGIMSLPDSHPLLPSDVAVPPRTIDLKPCKCCS